MSGERLQYGAGDSPTRFTVEPQPGRWDPQMGRIITELEDAAYKRGWNDAVDRTVTLLDAERARLAVLADALTAIAEADDKARRGPGNLAQRLGALLTATFTARTALANLPVERVAPSFDHEHYWIDAPDDETGWHCTICGVTEYPGMKDELTPNEFAAQRLTETTEAET